METDQRREGTGKQMLEIPEDTKMNRTEGGVLSVATNTENEKIRHKLGHPGPSISLDVCT